MSAKSRKLIQAINNRQQYIEGNYDFVVGAETIALYINNYCIFMMDTDSESTGYQDIYFRVKHHWNIQNRRILNEIFSSFGLEDKLTVEYNSLRLNSRECLTNGRGWGCIKRNRPTE